jgi:hypothetical protein
MESAPDTRLVLNANLTKVDHACLHYPGQPLL